MKSEENVKVINWNENDILVKEEHDKKNNLLVINVSLRRKNEKKN